MSWIGTYTGEKFVFNNIEKNKIHIEDIAHSLSMLCRYNGHCKKFYSVEEHSILVSSVLLDELKIHGLLHDAAEAFISDIPKLFKKTIPNIKETEELILRHIYSELKIQYPSELEIRIIKVVDTRMLQTERKILMPDNDMVWGYMDDIKPYDNIKISNYLPDNAKLFFMKEYNILNKLK
jgi:hypothetical protein